MFFNPKLAPTMSMVASEFIAEMPTVNRFAIQQEYRNLIAALSLLATVEIEVIQSLIEEGNDDGLIIACRASRLNWQTALAVHIHRKNARQFSPLELERCQESFEALPLSVAQRTIRFGPVRDYAAKFVSDENTLTAAGVDR